VSGWEPDSWEPGWDPGPLPECKGCGIEDGCLPPSGYCSDCEQEQEEEEAFGPDYFDAPRFTGEPGFADPGGRSALRAASASNPRSLPCPTCGAPDRLTPADRARGYQCDPCADRVEHGGY
jgi:hypothetical protein